MIGDVLQKVNFYDRGGRSFTRYGIEMAEYDDGIEALTFSGLNGMYSGFWEKGSFVRTGEKVDMSVIEKIVERGTV